MALAEPSFLNDNEGEEAGAAERLFVRIISISPGAPWDQSRQADLEARLGAPSRLADLVYRVRRLDPWRPAKPSRFAAIYARAQDTHEGLHATATVEGRAISVSFVSPALQARRIRSVAVLALGAAAAAMLLLGLVATVGARRMQTDRLLTAVEQRAAVRVRQAGEVSRAERQAEILDEFHLREQRLSQPLADIAWASAAKIPNAHVQALHWNQGFLALEAGGESPPLDSPDHPLQRSRAPVRPGLWLWGASSMEAWGDGSAARGRTP